MINLEIIEYQFTDKVVNTINSRELYFELGLAKGQYSRWIKLNLYDNPFFVENIDFMRVRHNVEGNEVVSAMVTIDTAKHLAMVSRSKKAHEIREYFIEVEKRFREQSQNSETQFDRELKAFNNSVEMLRVNGASKIKMIRTFHESQNLETSYLPEYSDENHTFALTHLLKKFGVKMSAQKFNKLLISAGFLEIKTRKSSKYKTEKDEKGLEFGKNMISEKNQLETQPHYFENKFSELLKILEIQ
jgi:phage anti-repressor protein